jgi:Fe-S oxidoreductase
MFGPELLGAFRRFKSIWDPDGMMNPGKVIDPAPILAHLRLGADYHPGHPPTHFSYPDDEHNFSRAALRCVGVGKCRREEGGTMCPSYMVTREERHSTRGRARLLFEMLQGDPLTEGWHSAAVKDALDLCLSCKGCKGDCPVHVDMATYKAEFLAHYYRRRVRPRHMYVFGLIAQWARLGALFPAVTNFLERAPFWGDAVKRLIGVAPQRELPRFAPATFKAWFFRRPPRNPAGPPVVLWADTFNNHFHPEVARAATRFLERAGWNVIVPRAALCCGRPLYDFGMLNTARRWLREILTSLRKEIRGGVPMVGLEPSCVATFRDELTNLLPQDEDAARLARQTFLLSEFIEAHMPDEALPRLERRALVHGHCHHKAVMKFTAEEKVLRQLGLEVEVLDSGCCGMAGAFGFEAEHCDVSVACGERVLLPRVRGASEDTLIIADGFSCREQIRQTTPRRALHLAQVLELGAREGPAGPRRPRPEQACLPPEPRAPSAVSALLAIAGSAAVVAGGAAWWLGRRRTRHAGRRQRLASCSSS